MAACGSLQHIFENPLPAENPTLLESLSSWNKIKPVKPIEQSSFTEIFGELHFKENPQSSSSSSSSSSSLLPMSSSSLIGLNPVSEGVKKLKEEHHGSWGNLSDEINKSSLMDSSSTTSYTSCHGRSDSFSSMNSESLQLCTEGLGFESSADVEDLKNDINKDWENQGQRVSVTKHSPRGCCQSSDVRRSRTNGGAFPPPISCIGQTGKPWVCFKSYRQDGRFVLKEIRIPRQEVLHACREDGRLKLHFVQPNDDIPEGEEDEDEDEEDEEYEQDNIVLEDKVEET